MNNNTNHKEEVNRKLRERSREREIHCDLNDNYNEYYVCYEDNDDKMNVEINRKNRLLLRKNRIKQIQKKYTAEIEQDEHCEINQHKCNQIECNDKDNQIQKEESKDNGDNASSSLSDMFEFSDDNNEHNNNTNKKKNVIDLGLTSKNESIGYYSPQINEIIYDKYKVIGLCGKGIFSSVFKVQDIHTNKLYSLKMIRNIDIMKLSGQKERQILSNLTTNSSQSKFKFIIFKQTIIEPNHIIQLLNSFEFNNHICMLFSLFKMNLRDMLKEQPYTKGLSLSLLKSFSKQLITAFITLHSKRLIHADCKYFS